ncbi:quinoprotein relay system zinc metallohydrolase 1 [Solimonas variicoloris]|uniref:quinoprotein relay system zinc metallohydrolase 1 n=1 Tax=Solimonas variicoloris TaxID=254408 RepID=UPI0003802FF8|nr:quinoprotein relay system zinc metallohydrolase 1 [Solimonas variicoloris]
MRRLPFSSALLALLAVGAAHAQYDYRLAPQALGDGAYVFVGALEHFTRANGGNIVNTGYIDTPAGAVVIDSGPSRLYGEQQRALIERRSGRPVARVYITHAHPDHFFGDQAYAGVPVYALPATREAIAANGDALADNLYRLVGDAMRGTHAVAPGLPAGAGRIEVGGRALQLIALAGHTDADLAVFDERSATLYAGDLVFHRRTPTTPNADLARWLAALDRLETIPYKTLVPGHGPVLNGPAAIRETRDYLRWLDAMLREAAARGVDLPELAELPVPERFGDFAVLRAELSRSAAHLYPALETQALRRLAPDGRE